MINWKERCQQILAQQIREEQLAGASILVFHKGKEIFYHQDGLAARDKKVPIRRDTIFRIFSMTKPVTAAAVMMLVDRGELDLMDPVSKFLPEFSQLKVYDGKELRAAVNPVTIRSLLQMTSGFVYPNAPGLCGEQTQKVYDETEALRNTPDSLTTRKTAARFARCPLLFEPCTGWFYGVSADILGAVVEAVSGRSFGAFLKENIFDVLGMPDTGFYVPQEKYDRLAKVYKVIPNAPMEEYHTNYLGISIAMDQPPAFESGGAGLVSTIDDYRKFARMLLSDGIFEGKRLLSREAVQRMRTASLTPAQLPAFADIPFNNGFTYGYLMRNMVDPASSHQYGSVGEYGWEGWLGSYFFCDPEQDLLMLFMTQTYDGGYIPCVRRMRNTIYHQLSEGAGL